MATCLSEARAASPGGSSGDAPAAAAASSPSAALPEEQLTSLAFRRDRSLGRSATNARTRALRTSRPADLPTNRHSRGRAVSQELSELLGLARGGRVRSREAGARTHRPDALGVDPPYAFARPSICRPVRPARPRTRSQIHPPHTRDRPRCLARILNALALKNFLLASSCSSYCGPFDSSRSRRRRCIDAA
jgi:hypothetical protein